MLPLVGYSAKIQFDKKYWVVVSVFDEFLGVISCNDGSTRNLALTENKIKIDSFIYAGHLFGEPVIPEGQRFRVKETGEVGEFMFEERSVVKLACPAYNMSILFQKEELEPIFD